MGRTIKVLLSDDHNNATKQLVTELGCFGFMVCLCSKDGGELLQCIEREKPDVIIMDAFIQKIDALGILSRLDSLKLTEIPLIIVLSGADNTNLERLVMRSGADYYFLKPIDAKIVAERVNQLVQLKSVPVSPRTELMDDLNVAISGILNRIGISANVKGYYYLRSAIYLSVKKPQILSLTTKVMYPEIAKEYSTTPYNVERAIRYAIEIAWNRGNAEIITAYFGKSPNSKKPTNTQFIATITDTILLKRGLW